jgi:D-sedoheptulose 7-phosphate isomerase
MNRTKVLSELISGMVAQSLDVKARFFADNASRLAEVAAVLAHGFRSGHKILLFGNGGSAADAQHIAAEFVGRFVPDRPALPALSLSTDTSVLTSVGNDYGFDHIFARQIEALGQAGDTAIAMSTSGNSPNVLAGIAAARSRGMYTVGLTGEGGGKMIDQVEVLFCVPTRYTPRIQETHMMIGHVLGELVDRLMFPELYPQD